MNIVDKKTIKFYYFNVFFNEIKSVISDTYHIDKDTIETEVHYDERRKVLQGVCVVPKPTEARGIDNLYYPAKIIWRTQVTTPHDIFLI